MENGFERYEVTVRNKEGKLIYLQSVHSESHLLRILEEEKNNVVEVEKIYKDASEY